LSFMQHSEDITGSLGRPLPDGTWTTLTFTHDEFYTAWVQGRSGRPDKLTEKPTTQQRNVVLHTANPLTSLRQSWFELVYPYGGRIENPSQWLHKFRARNPDSYFHWRLLSVTEISLYGHLSRAGNNYVYELTGTYSNPMQTDDRLVPSFRLEEVPAMAAPDLNYVCHPELWCGPLYVGDAGERQRISTMADPGLPIPLDHEVSPTLRDVDTLLQNELESTPLYALTGLPWHRHDLRMLPMYPL